jgi:ubiquinone/menaquinone biosynthesis C-methylase UbiE
MMPPRRKSLYAPRSLDFVGGGPDFERGAREFLKHHIELAGLQPHESVLDVGCGIGRLAASLTGYLNGKGSYDGFDIVKLGIRWSSYHISRQYPSFKFLHADIYSAMYNPKGIYKASEYQFPYPNAKFDYVFLTSVFTHMLPPDMQHYLREIARVLKPGGRALITYFVLNNESRDRVQQGTSQLRFAPYLPECWTSDKNNPESALAYDERYIIEAHRNAGLPIDQTIYYGFWAGRAKYTSFQDITISRKIK